MHGPSTQDGFAINCTQVANYVRAIAPATREALAPSAASVGVPGHKIRQQTGHASDAMLSRYIRVGELFTKNAVNALL